MPKVKKENIGSTAPATKGDIEQLREDLHADMVENFATKQDLERFATKEDLQQFVTKDDLQEALRASEDRVITSMQAYYENAKTDLEAANQDQLDIVTEKKDAPPKWKSVPRRLKTVEMEVEKIKDKLA